MNPYPYTFEITSGGWYCAQCGQWVYGSQHSCLPASSPYAQATDQSILSEILSILLRMDQRLYALELWMRERR